MSLVVELRRRNVFRVAAAYLVVGWLLTEVLTTILPTLGAAEWASRAVILTFAFGFIPAVVLSWFYEITPEGIKRDHEVDHDHHEIQRVNKLDKATIGTAIALIVVIGLFSARYTADESTDVNVAISDTSVAVLPFVNMSDDKDNEYFSDGLTETLLHMLTQIPDLKVAARTSSFAFKGQSLSIQDIARALEVAHVLEGSVQRAGDRVRVTAQLIRASDGFHVWSQVYDRTLDDIFEIQDEIAGEVGHALSKSLLGTENESLFAGIATTDADAYDLYLQARKERATYSYGGLQAAEDLLKGALLIDPDFTDAKTELAASYIHQWETGLMDEPTALGEIIAITDQVLADDPDEPVAKAASLFAKALSLAREHRRNSSHACCS
jgi:TolB-like protein